MWRYASGGFVLALALTLAGLALAADLGGNCCVDLEERVAELEATTARKGNRKVTVTVYGQVNKAILWTKAGDTTEEEVIDNGVSHTRFGFMGEAKFAQGWKAGYRLEIGVNNTPSIPILDDQLTVRHSYWWIEGPIGRVSMGLTSMATDGIAQITVANTDVASRMLSLQPLSSAFLGGIDLPFNDLRRDLVRYDTPTVGGFYGSVSIANGDTPFGVGVNPDQVWDVALRYAGEFAGFRVAGGVGYSHQDQNLGLLPSITVSTRDTVLSGSASVMHLGSGLFVNVGAGSVKAEFGFVDYRVGHLQGGIQKNWFGIGATTLYAEYAQMKIDGTDVSPNMMGLGVVQAIDAAAMDIYVAWRRYDLDFGGDEIDTLMAGARIRF